MWNALIMATKRAKAGGEFGANGEWYEGGKFLNTVPENRKREGSHPKRAAGRVEIEPYVWATPEDGQRSIYRRMQGNFGRIENGVMVVRVSQQTLAYFGETLESVQSMADAYNSGIRWY